jgi:hypothetical protein
VGPSNRWLPLYELLGIPPLDAKTLIRRFILPDYPQLGGAEKLQALSWIRDHLDSALTELDALGGDSARLVAHLGEAPLILASDDKYHAPRCVYDPRSEIVKEVLGEEVPMPDMRHYLGGSTHWLEFFARLGMVSHPKGRDLSRRIDQLVQHAKTGGVTQPIRARLTTIYTHIADHWPDLKDAVVHVPQQKKFVEFLKETRWLPVEHNPKELEQWASEFIPEDRLHAPNEVHLAQNASLVASQRPIFRGRQPELAMREALAFPKQVEKELLLKHFEAVIKLWERDSTRLSPERWTSVLNAIYRELNRFVSDEEDSNGVEARAIKVRFAESCCLWSGAKFWKPEHAFQAKVPFFGLRRTRLQPAPAVLPAYKLLGLRNEPGLEDFTAYFSEVANDFPNRLLPEAELNNALVAYRKFGEELRGTDFRDSALIVLIASGKLKPAREVFFGDAYWLEERIMPGAVKLLHPGLPATVREAGQVRSLAAAIRERPIAVPEKTESPRWSSITARWQERIRSAEFRSALERLIFHEGGASRAHDLDWLKHISITLTAAITTDLLIQDDCGEWVKVGDGQGETYFDPESNTVFLNIEGEELMRNRLARKVVQQLGDTPIRDFSPLETLLECNPNEMETRLNRLHIRRLQAPEPLPEEYAEVEDEPGAEMSREPDAEDTEPTEDPVSDGVDDLETCSPEEDKLEAPEKSAVPRQSPPTTGRRVPAGPSQGTPGGAGPSPSAPCPLHPAPASRVRQDRVATHVRATDIPVAEAAASASDQAEHETSRPRTAMTDQAQERSHESVTHTQNELHDPHTVTADFIEVGGDARPRLRRERKQQTQESRSESTNGSSLPSVGNDPALEQRGRDFAAKKLESMGYKVTPMAQGNPGFDLRAEKAGEAIKVEVKAHRGKQSTVFVTRREWKEYRRTPGVNGETWELWNVENLLKSSGNKPRIGRVRHIPESAKKESGYWIDLGQCSQEQLLSEM